MKSTPSIPLIAALLIVGLLASLLTGCTRGTKGPDRHERLLARIDQFVSAQNKGDLETTYRFFSPSFRDQYTLVNFVKINSGTPVKMKLAAVDYQDAADTADVTMLGSFFIMGFEIKGIQMEQQWEYTDGDWFIQANPPVSMETLFMNMGPAKGKKP